MNQTEKVARARNWLLRQQRRHRKLAESYPTGDPRRKNHEDVIQHCDTLLISLIDQQAEPVGWVSSYQPEQVASDPRILGIVTTLYKHKPEGTTFHVPLYLHPPASQEADDGTE